jgi:O-antigen/teichoic acid export membrane protein
VTDERLGAGEVRDRAVGGAAVLGARGALVYALGIVANIALARLLVPRDFGLVALGSVLLVVGAYFTDGGLGAALIRREKPPERADLASVAGLQLAVAVAIAAVGAAAAATFGRDGLVVAVMLASLPIATLRLPAGIVLEHRLEYRPIAFVDLVEAVSYYAWALVAVALGFGVWGLATAVVARAVIGVGTMARVGPVGLVWPRWSWRRVRPLLAFGAKLQATAIVAMVRDQGVNVGVAAVAGIATLGVWNLAFRILQVPSLLITTATRVSYPAVSRLLDAGEDPRAAIERGIGTVAVGMAVVLVALVGFAPALPVLLGNGWGDVPETLLWSSVGVLLMAPVVVATIGYLYATDHAGTVVWGAVAQTLLWIGVTLPLVASLGAPAVGIGSIPAGIAIAAIMGRRTRRLTGAAILKSLAAPAAVALAAGAAGWAIATAAGETLPAGAAGLLAGELVLLAGLAAVNRPLLSSTWALGARAVRNSLGRQQDTPVAHVAGDRAV